MARERELLKSTGIQDVFTVSELTLAIRGTLEMAFPGIILLEGELSNVRIARPSGHCYLTLKDDLCQIRGVFFKGAMESSRVRPEDGLKVLIRARLGVYEARGEYQLVIQSMEPSGVGRFHLEFRRVRELLEKEGLLAPGRKRLLPAYPGKVAILTSQTGSVLWDFLRISGLRGPQIPIVVVPVRVQGAGVPEEIAAALGAAQRLPGVEVIVIARGGGSIEDLWPFNSERLARAILSSPVPVVSAIGHETDWTIADLVADLRVATPSEAAEKIFPDRRPALSALKILDVRLRREISRRLSESVSEKRYLDGRLLRFPELIEGRISRLERLSGQLVSRMGERLAGEKRVVDSRTDRVQELFLGQKASLFSRLSRISDRLRSPSEKTMVNQRILSRLTGDLFRLSTRWVQTSSEQNRMLKDRLERGMVQWITPYRERLGRLEGEITQLGPMGVLQKGYALLFHEQTGHLVTGALPPEEGERLVALIHGYRLGVTVDRVETSRLPAIGEVSGV